MDGERHDQVWLAFLMSGRLTEDRRRENDDRLRPPTTGPVRASNDWYFSLPDDDGREAITSS